LFFSTSFPQFGHVPSMLSSGIPDILVPKWEARPLRKTAHSSAVTGSVLSPTKGAINWVFADSFCSSVACSLSMMAVKVSSVSFLKALFHLIFIFLFPLKLKLYCQ
ncbi:hypothetical protein ADUPG1_004933, partial [Aduncisulcus paluster]